MRDKRHKARSAEPRFRLDAIIVDESTGRTWVRVAYRDTVGKKRQVDLARSDFFELKSLKRILANANAAFCVEDKETTTLLRELQRQAPLELHTRLAAAGWTSDRTAFSLANVIVGAPRDTNLLPPHDVRDGGRIRDQCCGTLEDWKKLVAFPLRFSSAGIIALSAPCAAPLLRLLHFPSFGLNLYAPSKVSKTTLLSAAYSFQGPAEVLPRFDSTLAGRISLAKEHNDTMLPMDEVGLVTGTPAQIAEFNRAGLFALTARQDKRRHSSCPQDLGCDFLTIWMASAERSFAEFAASAGTSRDAGEQARCLDLSASDDGQSIYDLFPTDWTDEARRAFIEKAGNQLRESIPMQYGVPMIAYLRRLVRNPTRVVALAKDCIDDFLRCSEVKNISPARLHAIKCLAVSCAGGTQGVRFGVLPFSEQQVRDAHLLHARRALTEDASHSQRAKDILRDACKNLPLYRAGKPFDSRSIQGYRERCGSNTRVEIRMRDFREMFRDEPDLATLAINWLRKTRRLEEVKSTRRPRPVDGSRKWPDGLYVRSICFNTRPDLIQGR